MKYFFIRIYIFNKISNLDLIKNNKPVEFKTNLFNSKYIAI